MRSGWAGKGRVTLSKGYGRSQKAVGARGVEGLRLLPCLVPLLLVCQVWHIFAGLSRANSDPCNCSSEFHASTSNDDGFGCY
jgi:hypothetical protein